jgi:hypothetical protein
MSHGAARFTDDGVAAAGVVRFTTHAP